jgi:hypothetical protein
MGYKSMEYSKLWHSFSFGGPNIFMTLECFCLGWSMISFEASRELTCKYESITYCMYVVLFYTTSKNLLFELWGSPNIRVPPQQIARQLFLFIVQRTTFDSLIRAQLCEGNRTKVYWLYSWKKISCSPPNFQKSGHPN